MQIQGNTFLVSGGASGLGGATSRLLAAAGGNVVIADINAEKGAALAAELGAHTRFVQTNVADEAAVQNAVATAVSTFGALHGAISCAGIGVADHETWNLPEEVGELARAGSEDHLAIDRSDRARGIGGGVRQA